MIGRKPGELLLDEERTELLAIDFRENRKQIGEAGVGDPHFLAVENVVFAIGRQGGASPAIQSVGSGRGLRECIGADDFSCGQTGEILLLLFFRPKVDDRQRTDAGVPAPCRSEARILGNVVGDHRGGHFIHFQAAVRFRNFDGAQAEFARLLQQFTRDGEVLMLDLLHIRQDLVDRKFFRGLRNQVVLLGKVFRCEDFIRLALLKKK